MTCVLEIHGKRHTFFPCLSCNQRPPGATPDYSHSPDSKEVCGLPPADILEKQLAVAQDMEAAADQIINDPGRAGYPGGLFPNELGC